MGGNLLELINLESEAKQLHAAVKRNNEISAEYKMKLSQLSTDNKESLMKLGKILNDINDNKLFKLKHYDGFKPYCIHELGIDKSYAYKIMKSYKLYHDKNNDNKIKNKYKKYTQSALIRYTSLDDGVRKKVTPKTEEKILKQKANNVKNIITKLNKKKEEIKSNGCIIANEKIDNIIEEVKSEESLMVNLTIERQKYTDIKSTFGIRHISELMDIILNNQDVKELILNKCLENCFK